MLICECMFTKQMLSLGVGMVLSLFIRAVLLGGFTLLQECAHNSICQVGVYSRVYSRVVSCLLL